MAHLDGHSTVQRHLFGLEHRSHATPPHLPQQPEIAQPLRSQGVRRLGPVDELQAG